MTTGKLPHAEDFRNLGKAPSFCGAGPLVLKEPLASYFAPGGGPEEEH